LELLLLIEKKTLSVDQNGQLDDPLDLMSFKTLNFKNER